jgi:dihydroxyacetone kinase-like predicted kinase
MEELTMKKFIAIACILAMCLGIMAGCMEQVDESIDTSAPVGITLIYGEDVEEEDAQKAFDELQDKYGSRADVALVKGDQPVYYFILSIE